MRHLALLLTLLIGGLLLPNAAALAAAHTAAHAAAPTAASNFSAQFQKLRAQDDYLQQLGWRLRTGNAQFCRETTPAIGLLLQDATTYPDGNAVRNENDISGDFFIQSVASNSPAERAGLAPGMEISAVDGRLLSTFPLLPAENWKRLQLVHKAIRASLAENGNVALSVGPLPDGEARHSIEITGMPACPGRFELLTGHDTASANAERVAIGTDFIGLTYPQDEVAAVFAHELAHIILKHPQWLDANGRKRRNIRRTEREADQLMPWLLANAGYDPAAGVRFMQRWGPRHGGGFFRKRTHDGWDERIEFIEQQLPLIQQAISAEGLADWSGRFIARSPND